MKRIINGLDPVPELSNVRCYERFSDGNVAFQRNGTFYYGPIDKLSELFAGDDDGFLIDDEAEAKVAELHEQQDYRWYSKPHPDSDTELEATRQRWEHERRSGRWGEEAK
jgi:hypothetical protein